MNDKAIANLETVLTNLILAQAAIESNRDNKPQWIAIHTIKDELYQLQLRLDTLNERLKKHSK